MKSRLVLIAGVSLLVGCTASRFDRLFDAGAYPAALDAFAADSSLHDDEHALFRAAVARATPNQPAYDATEARRLLGQLLSRYPNSSYREQATALASSLLSADRLARDASRVEEQLATLRARIMSLEQRVAVQEALHDELTTGALAVRDTLERVQLQLRVREGQLRELQDELRALKQIDLGPIGRDTMPIEPE